MSRLFAANWDLTAEKQREGESELRAVPRCAELCGAFVALCSLSAARTQRKKQEKKVAICSDQKNKEKKKHSIYAFPQSENSSGFTRRSPHWSVQNNFLGWLYAIRCQSKLQPWAEMGRKWPRKQPGEQKCTMRAPWQEWMEAPATSQKDVLPPQKKLSRTACPSESSDAWKSGHTATPLCFLSAEVRQFTAWMSSQRVLPHSPDLCTSCFYSAFLLCPRVSRILYLVVLRHKDTAALYQLTRSKMAQLAKNVSTKIEKFCTCCVQATALFHFCFYGFN